MKSLLVSTVLLLTSYVSAQTHIPKVHCEGNWKSNDVNFSGNRMVVDIKERDSVTVLYRESYNLITGNKYESGFRNIDSYEFLDGSHQYCAVYAPLPLGCWMLKIDEKTKQGSLVAEGLSSKITFSDNLNCTFE